MKINQVDQISYNKDYYLNAYGDSFYDIRLKRFITEHETMYNKMASLIKLQNTDILVDFGCGNGNLSFLLSAHCGANIIGIDYSESAISICKKKLLTYEEFSGQNGNIKFYNFNNQDLPNFKKIDIVFFCDVIEHMYDDEINFVFDKIKNWNAEEGIRVVVHTDNNYYLKYIRPVLDFLYLILGKKNIKQIINEYKLEKKLHVNLTNPKQLRTKMVKLGFKEIVLEYSVVSKEIIKKQLGSLSDFPFIITISIFLLKHLMILSPTFYAVYRYEHE